MSTKVDRHANRMRFKQAEGRKANRLVSVTKRVEGTQQAMDNDFREQITEIYTQEQ